MPLPNPNIEFVPLDKLTAAQLNQLVANIIALADGTGLNNKSVNGDKLADKSVQLEHLSDSLSKLTWHNPTYQNGFKTYEGETYQKPQYAKDAFGVVHLRGLVANNNGGALEQAMFQLPSGFRPAKVEIFATPNANSIGRVNVLPSGEVQLSNTYSANSGWVSLSGISFLAA